MTTMSAHRTVVRTEFRLFTREPVGVLWGLALPVVALIVLACIPAVRAPESGLGGLSFLQVYQPTLLLFASALLALTSLPQIVAAYRERGVLRRLAVTPMPAARLLGAQVAIHGAVVVVAAVLSLVVGAIAGVGPGVHTAEWLLAALLSAAAMLGLGLVVASRARTGKSASAVGTILFMPLVFGSGLWVPLASMPPVLRTICEWSPLGAAARMMTAASSGGLGVGDWTAGAVLLGYAVVFGTLAVRWFRWE